MKLLRTAGMLLTIAGTILVFTLIKQVLAPGFLEFAGITAAHLFVSLGITLLTLAAVPRRALAVPLAVAWGGGWFLFSLGELLMLLFVLPPSWLSPVAVAAILLGGVAAAIVLLSGTGRPARAVPTPRGLLIFAILSSAPLWMYLLVAPLPMSAFVAGYWLRVLADVAAAAAILLLGARILRATGRPAR